MTRTIPDWLEVEPEIRRALDGGGPVVALESTVLTHGLPRPIPPPPAWPATSLPTWNTCG